MKTRWIRLKMETQRPKLHGEEDAAKGGAALGVLPAQSCELDGGEDPCMTDHEQVGHHRMESQECSPQAGR